MFALLLASAAFGIMMLSSKDAADKAPAATAFREWTDASGTRRVKAILLRVEGETLWLRRADGKLAIATISQLSPADRQYLEKWRITKPADSEMGQKATSLPIPILENVGKGLQTIAELPKWISGSQRDGPGGQVPAAVVYLRISRDFLQAYIERTVSRRKPVHDYILGVRIEGESETRGRTRLLLLPSSGRISGQLAFEGTVHAETRGYKSPVVLHQFSDSTFRSSKLVMLDELGLRTTRATTSAPTDLRTTGITSSLPRLRGRIATRIAWGRVSGSHQAAECITADHTAAMISSDFDESVDQSVAKVQKLFTSKIARLDDENRPLRTEMRFRSSAECVELAMIRREATVDERKLRPPRVEGNPDVAVRVHRAMMTRAAADPEIREDLAPLIKVLKSRFGLNETTDSKGDKGLPNGNAKWSFDLDWLTLDFKDSTPWHEQ
jgi:hypothetical protein